MCGWGAGGHGWGGGLLPPLLEKSPVHLELPPWPWEAPAQSLSFSTSSLLFEGLATSSFQRRLLQLHTPVLLEFTVWPAEWWQMGS